MATVASAQTTTRPKLNLFTKLFSNIWRGRLAYLYIFPAFLIMAFITFYPIAYQVWMSLTDFQLKHLRLSNPDFIWFTNYLQIIQSGLPVANFDFARILVFNVVWTAVNVFLHVSIGILIAIALNAEGLPNRRLYRSLYVIPWALPAMITGLTWANMWNEDFGAINLLLRSLDQPGTTRWLEDIHPVVNLPEIGLVLPLSFFAVLIANVWTGWPFMMVIATGALQSIPKELYEAARVDGATGWQQFWKITLPLIRPAMVPAVMIGIMWTFNQFNMIYFITGGGPLGMTEILVTQGFKLVNPQGWYGVASAFSIIVFGVLIVITLVTNRISRATEAYYA